ITTCAPPSPAVFPYTTLFRSQRQFGFVTSKQFYGMDILPFAVELAKVTMTLAHKLSIDELHIDEPALPLDNLDKNTRCMDALIRSEEHTSELQSRENLVCRLL